MSDKPNDDLPLVTRDGRPTRIEADAIASVLLDAGDTRPEIDTSPKALRDVAKRYEASYRHSPAGILLYALAAEKEAHEKAMVDLTLERDEARADAAAMRAAINYALSRRREYGFAISSVLEAALSSTAGRDLLERMERMREALRCLLGMIVIDNGVSSPRRLRKLTDDDWETILECEAALADKKEPTP